MSRRLYWRERRAQESDPDAQERWDKRNARQSQTRLERLAKEQEAAETDEEVRNRIAARRKKDRERKRKANLHDSEATKVSSQGYMSAAHTELSDAEEHERPFGKTPKRKFGPDMGSLPGSRLEVPTKQAYSNELGANLAPRHSYQLLRKDPGTPSIGNLPHPQGVFRTKDSPLPPDSNFADRERPKETTSSQQIGGPTIGSKRLFQRPTMLGRAPSFIELYSISQQHHSRQPSENRTQPATQFPTGWRSVVTEDPTLFEGETSKTDDCNPPASDERERRRR